MMFLSHLSCTSCGLGHEWNQLQILCRKGQQPLFAEYELAAVAKPLKRETLATRTKNLWRYREILPLPPEIEPVSLGEGGTPLLQTNRFGQSVGSTNVWIKDEAQNPTQS